MLKIKDLIFLMFINIKKNDAYLFEYRHLLNYEQQQLLSYIDSMKKEGYILYDADRKILSLTEKGIQYLKEKNLDTVDITKPVEKQLTFIESSDKIDFEYIYIPRDLSEFK